MGNWGVGGGHHCPCHLPRILLSAGEGAGSVEELLEIKTRPRKWLGSTVLGQKIIWRLDSRVLALRKTLRWLSELNQNFLLADLKQYKRANSSRDETPVYSCHVIFLCRV